MFDEYRKMRVEVKKLFLTFLLLRVIFELPIIFVIGIFVDFLMQSGLSLFEKNLMNVAFFGTRFVAEIPTGLFADVHGRKKSVMVACLFVACGYVFYGLAGSMWMFIMSESCIGIGRCFANGVFSSWFEDGLEALSATKEVSRSYVQAVASVAIRISFVLGSVIGGFVAGLYGFPILLFAGACMMLIALVAIYYRMEEYGNNRYLKAALKTSFREKLHRGCNQYAIIFKQSVGIFRKDRGLLFLLLFFCIYMFSIQTYNMDWQPWMRVMGHGTEAMGMYFSIMMILYAFGGWILTRCGTLVDGLAPFFVTGWCIAAIVLATVLLSEYLYLALILFLLHEIPRAICDSLVPAFYANRTPPETRATVCSCIYQAGHIGAVIGLLVSGLIAQFWGIMCSWVISSIALILLPSVIYLIVFRKK